MACSNCEMCRDYIAAAGGEATWGGPPRPADPANSRTLFARGMTADSAAAYDAAHRRTRISRANLHARIPEVVMEFCRTETRGHVLYVTITCPKVMNALHAPANLELN